MLLGADVSFVKKGQAIALTHLTANLARNGTLLGYVEQIEVCVTPFRGGLRIVRERRE